VKILKQVSKTKMSFRKFEDLNALCDRENLPMFAISQERIDQITALPVPNRRCSTYKKFIRVDRDCVYKGPYTLFEKKFYRELGNKFAIDMLCRKFNLPNINISIQSVLMFQYSIFYIKYDKVHSPFLVPRLHDHRDCVGVTVKMIEKIHNCLKVCDAEELLVDVEVRKSILQHLYFRYLLGIGDIGTHNILFDHDFKQVYGVDFEEMGGVRNPNTKLECLDKKKDSLKKKMIFEPYINSIWQPNEQELEEIEEDLKNYFIDSKIVIRRMKYFKTFV